MAAEQTGEYYNFYRSHYGGNLIAPNTANTDFDGPHETITEAVDALREALRFDSQARQKGNPYQYVGTVVVSDDGLDEINLTDEAEEADTHDYQNYMDDERYGSYEEQHQLRHGDLI